MGKKGLQLYTVRELMEKDVVQTLKKIARYGYEGVQFAGYYNIPANLMNDWLHWLELKPAGSHIPLEQLTGDPLKRQIEYNQEIGNDLFILPYLVPEQRKSLEDYKRIAGNLNEIGAILRSEGITLAYHNHDFEFYPLGNTIGYEVFLQETDPNLVKFELDVYWASYAGYDPISLINKIKDRLVTLHIKDLIEKDGMKKSTVIGQGQLNIKEIFEKGRELYLPWFIVEQEHFEYDILSEVAQNVVMLEKIAKGR